MCRLVEPGGVLPRKLRSAGVLACKFRRCPAASSRTRTGTVLELAAEDGRATRRRRFSRNLRGALGCSLRQCTACCGWGFLPSPGQEESQGSAGGSPHQPSSMVRAREKPRLDRRPRTVQTVHCAVEPRRSQRRAELCRIAELHSANRTAAGDLSCFGRFAECNSAIRQIKNLRYAPWKPPLIAEARASKLSRPFRCSRAPLPHPPESDSKPAAGARPDCRKGS